MELQICKIDVNTENETETKNKKIVVINVQCNTIKNNVHWRGNFSFVRNSLTLNIIME